VRGGSSDKCPTGQTRNADGACAVPPAPPPAPATFSDAALPEGASGITYNADDRETYQLAAGKETKDAIGSNVTVQCPETATNGCRWRVTASNGIEQIGGATVVLTSSLPNPNVATSSSTPGTDSSASNYRSVANLLNIFEHDSGIKIKSSGIDKSNDGNDFRGIVVGTNLQISNPFKAFHLHDGNSGAPKKEDEQFYLATNIDAPATSQGGPAVPDSDYIVYGAWMKNPNKNAGMFVPIYGGKMPYEISEIDADENTATYSGNALIRHRQREGTKTLGDWGLASGAVNLSANFEEGKVSGTITPTPLGANWRIRLMSSDFGSEGKATITQKSSNDPIPNGAGSSGVLASNGEWKAKLFGPKGNKPTAFAGDFEASAGRRAPVSRTVNGVTTNTETFSAGGIAFVEAHGTFGAE